MTRFILSAITIFGFYFQTNALTLKTSETIFKTFEICALKSGYFLKRKNISKATDGSLQKIEYYSLDPERTIGFDGKNIVTISLLENNKILFLENYNNPRTFSYNLTNDKLTSIDAFYRLWILTFDSNESPIKFEYKYWSKSGKKKFVRSPFEVVYDKDQNIIKMITYKITGKGSDRSKVKTIEKRVYTTDTYSYTNGDNNYEVSQTHIRKNYDNEGKEISEYKEITNHKMLTMDDQTIKHTLHLTRSGNTRTLVYTYKDGLATSISDQWSSNTKLTVVSFTYTNNKLDQENVIIYEDGKVVNKKDTYYYYTSALRAYSKTDYEDKQTRFTQVYNSKNELVEEYKTNQGTRKKTNGTWGDWQRARCGVRKQL